MDGQTVLYCSLNLNFHNPVLLPLPSSLIFCYIEFWSVPSKWLEEKKWTPYPRTGPVVLRDPKSGRPFFDKGRSTCTNCRRRRDVTVKKWQPSCPSLLEQDRLRLVELWRVSIWNRPSFPSSTFCGNLFSSVMTSVCTTSFLDSVQFFFFLDSRRNLLPRPFGMCVIPRRNRTLDDLKGRPLRRPVQLHWPQDLYGCNPMLKVFV